MPRSGSHGGATTAIGVAAYAYARKKEMPTFIKALKAMKGTDDGRRRRLSVSTTTYYAAQGFFQGDFKAWQGWNDRQVKRLTEMQNDDGSWDAGLGPGTCTALALAVHCAELPLPADLRTLMKVRGLPRRHAGDARSLHPGGLARRGPSKSTGSTFSTTARPRTPRACRS